MNNGSEDLIVKEPENWICDVISYWLDHSSLQIRLQSVNTQEEVHLDFLNVKYFEGPITWKGAKFSVASMEICLDLLEVTGQQNLLESVKISREFSLFICPIINSPRGERMTKIVASLVAKKPK